MNEVLGAILRVQFGRLDGILARLRERRDWMLDAVRAEKAPVALSPSADLAGDCGCNATFLFKTAADRNVWPPVPRNWMPPAGSAAPSTAACTSMPNWSVLLNRQGGTPGSGTPSS